MTNPADDLTAELAYRNCKAMDMATDPPVSEAQRKAMFAAREGRSTLGIPKKVGEEFVGKGKDDYPGYMPYRPVTEQDIVDKETLLANATKDSPDHNRLVDEIERLKAQIKAQGGRMGGRANDRRPKR